MSAPSRCRNKEAAGAYDAVSLCTSAAGRVADARSSEIAPSGRWRCSWSLSGAARGMSGDFTTAISDHRAPSRARQMIAWHAASPARHQTIFEWHQLRLFEPTPSVKRSRATGVKQDDVKASIVAIPWAGAAAASKRSRRHGICNELPSDARSLHSHIRDE